jgi:hypothetical protein
MSRCADHHDRSTGPRSSDRRETTPPIVAKRHHPGIDDLQSFSSAALTGSEADDHLRIPEGSPATDLLEPDIQLGVSHAAEERTLTEHLQEVRCLRLPRLKLEDEEPAHAVDGHQIRLFLPCAGLHQQEQLVIAKKTIQRAK